jgi:septal ring factor EnvC (AmiA/AmiB activator)
MMKRKTAGLELKIKPCYYAGLILGLALLLLPCGRLLAWNESTRMDAIASKAEQANEGVRNVQSKIDDLQMKINRLEDKINSRDYKVEALERKLREQDILDRRVKALEDAREDRKLSAQTRAIAGKMNP